MRDLCLTLSLAVFLTAGPLRAEDQPQGLAAPAAAPAISTVEIALVEMTERVFASGLIVPVEEIAIAPQVEGQRIEALLADVGDTVAAGQVLAELSDESLILRRGQLQAGRASALAAVAGAEAQLLEARTAADEAIRARDRAEALRRDGNISQAAFDQTLAGAAAGLARVTAAEQSIAAAQAQADLADLQIADIDLSIQRTRITAPAAGVVSARNAQLGAIASAAGQPMFTLIRDGALELRADVSEGDLMRLSAGQAAQIRAIGLALPLSGQVRLVEPGVDLATRLGRVRIAIPEGGPLRAGLFAEAEIILDRREVAAAPVTALGQGGTGPMLLTVDAGGVVHEAPVIAGLRDGALVEIREGAAPGMQVVARAGAFVRPGDRISPVPVTE